MFNANCVALDCYLNEYVFFIELVLYEATFQRLALLHHMKLLKKYFIDFVYVILLNSRVNDSMSLWWG